MSEIHKIIQVKSEKKCINKKKYPIEEEWMKYEKDGNYNKFIDVLNEGVGSNYIYFIYIDKLILKGLSDNNKSLIKCCMDIYCSYNKYDKEEEEVEGVEGIHYLYLLLTSKLFKDNKNNEEKYKIIETYLSKKDTNDLNLLNKFISISLPTGNINNDIDETNIDKLIEIYKKSFPNDKYTNYFINKLFITKNKNTNKNNLVIKNFLELFINKIIPKDYKFDKQHLGLLFHIGEISVLKKNNLVNIEFLEYCFDKWTENIDMYLEKYELNLIFILDKFYNKKIIKWDNIKNKIIDSYNSYVDKYYSEEEEEEEYIHTNKLNWINNIEIFLEQKVIPTKKLFDSICKFMVIKRILSNKKLIDITDFVNLMTKYGYNFTIDDAINLVKNYLYISNINEYDIDLKDNELLKVVKELNYNPYNIKIELTIEMLEEKCKNKLSLSDIKEILKQNKNLKLNGKCLENLISFDNSNIISYVIKTYNLQPTMKCVKIAVDNKWSVSKIKILFDPIYLDYLEKEKKIEIKNEPIECVPKKKNNISSK